MSDCRYSVSPVNYPDPDSDSGSRVANSVADQIKAAFRFSFNAM